jgi:TatD DNase family protein
MIADPIAPDHGLELVDTHAHLEQLADPEDALEQARAAGVARVIAVSMDLESARRILDLARAHPGTVFPALGIHPWRVSCEDPRPLFQLLERHAGELAAVGEIGLDAKIATPLEDQLRVFRRCLQLARAAGLPVSVHARGAQRLCLDEVRAAGIAKAVFHWYSGPRTVLREIVADGFFVSATPAVRRSGRHRKCIAIVPPEQLLLESDCPWPVNEEAETPSGPEVTRLALAGVSDLQGATEAAVARQTTRNAERCFALLRRPAPDGPADC